MPDTSRNILRKERKPNMLNEPTITISGNLTGDPELRFTAAGQPVATFSVASNPRFQNRETGEWENGTAVFLRVTAWRDLAENVCESLRRGDPVIVVGRFRQRTWTDEATGADRRADDVQADTVAVPLDRRRVRMVKVTRERAGNGGPESPGTEPGPAHAAGAGEPAAGRTEPGSGTTAGMPGEAG